MDGFKIVFATTAGYTYAYPTVINNSPFLSTTGFAQSFVTVVNSSPFFSTIGFKSAYAVTVSQSPFLSTSGFHVAFPVVPDCIGNANKLLQLRFDPFEVAQDYTTIKSVDGTGEYDALTNPTGYTPENDPDNYPLRPKRNQLNLFQAYRLWTSSTTVPPIIFPGAGTPDLDPYENTITTNGNGVYQMYMIGTPLSTTYADLIALGNTVFDYANCAFDWYGTMGAVIVDPDIYNCINNKRFEFLTGVMCGNCDNKYLEMYALLVGALNAFNIGTTASYIDGMILLDRLKEECAAQGCKCSCTSSCNC